MMHLAPCVSWAASVPGGGALRNPFAGGWRATVSLPRPRLGTPSEPATPSHPDCASGVPRAARLCRLRV